MCIYTNTNAGGAGARLEKSAASPTATHCNTLQHTATHTYHCRWGRSRIDAGPMHGYIHPAHGITAVCCSVLQCVAVCCSELFSPRHRFTGQHSQTVSSSLWRLNWVVSWLLRRSTGLTAHCNAPQHTPTLQHAATNTSPTSHRSDITPLRHHTAALTVAVLMIWVVVATRCITLQYTATRCNTYLSDMTLLRLLRRCWCSRLSATPSRTGDAEADLSRMSRYFSSLSILLEPASTCDTVCECRSWGLGVFVAIACVIGVWIHVFIYICMPQAYRPSTSPYGVAIACVIGVWTHVSVVWLHLLFVSTLITNSNKFKTHIYRCTHTNKLCMYIR